MPQVRYAYNNPHVLFLSERTATASLLRQPASVVNSLTDIPSSLLIDLVNLVSILSLLTLLLSSLCFLQYSSSFSGESAQAKTTSRLQSNFMLMF